MSLWTKNCQARANTVMALAFKPAWNARSAEAEGTAWLWRESYNRIDRTVGRGSNPNVGVGPSEVELKFAPSAPLFAPCQCGDLVGPDTWLGGRHETFPGKLLQEPAEFP